MSMCIYSHEDGAYCDKHDHGAVTVGCSGEENCPDKRVLTMADEYVSKDSVLNSIHSGDIDMGMVTPHEYRLLKELSRRIDRRIQRVPVADVSPIRHGRWGHRWICSNLTGYEYACSCSECGKPTYRISTIEPMPPYCPNCGAYMGEEGEQG